MRNRVENLGDYNQARILLQEKNGNLSELIKESKNTGALEALPKQIGLGILIGAPVWLGGEFIVKKVHSYIRKRKKAKEMEEELEKELKNALSTDEISAREDDISC